MPLNVAVIGLGVGEQHARAFAARDDCRVAWLYDLDAAKAERLAADLGQGRVAESYDQVLADPAVDIVSIATFDHLHFDEVCRAFDVGKHVFVEKPLCRTAAEVDALRARWAKAGKEPVELGIGQRDVAGRD